MSTAHRKILDETTDVIGRVLREHRYFHNEGTGDATCECGVKAPITVCEWDIRHHISEQIANALSGGE